MAKPIDNSATTDKQVVTNIKPGEYVVAMSGATATTATVAVFRRGLGQTASEDLPFSENGAAISLTKDDPAKRITVGSEDVVVQRATGVDLISVDITRLPV